MLDNVDNVYQIAAGTLVKVPFLFVKGSHIIDNGQMVFYQDEISVQAWVCEIDARANGEFHRREHVAD